MRDVFALAADILDPQPTEFEHDWRTWLRTMFPAYCTAPFADFHEEFWEWLWAIERGVRPDPFVGLWFRGAAKSTSAELGLTALAAKGARSYFLYVCETQDQADDHVGNVAGLLEKSSVDAHYPLLASRMVGKYGNSKGWRRNRLRTSSGFTVDALGLDTAARGVKLDEHRPDGMVFDDVDNKKDKLAQVQSKIDTITATLIPAGSRDVALMFIQNLIHENSIASQLNDGRAEFMANRIVSGPVPAVRDFECERVIRQDDRAGYKITKGTATWPGFDLDACQGLLDDIGRAAFLTECQHDVEPPPGGMFDHLDFDAIRCDPSEVPWGLAVRTVVWVDPAVTDKDSSDSHAIQADMLSVEGRVYRLFSWERRTTPVDSLKRAIRVACEYKAEHVGVETDQGGDTWHSVWREAVEEMRKVFEAEGDADALKHLDMLGFRTAKAGSIGSKTHRASLMLADYEHGRYVHVRGTHNVLEKALRRFPRTKPFDLTDAAFWSGDDLLGGSSQPLDPDSHRTHKRKSLGREAVVLPPDTDMHIMPSSAPPVRKRQGPKW